MAILKVYQKITKEVKSVMLNQVKGDSQVTPNLNQNIWHINMQEIEKFWILQDLLIKKLINMKWTAALTFLNPKIYKVKAYLMKKTIPNNRLFQEMVIVVSGLITCQEYPKKVAKAAAARVSFLKIVNMFLTWT